MKNPDIVCRHRTLGTWRFIEVKRDETVPQAQVNALALLHELTGAEVEIRRLIPRDRKRPGPRTGERALCRSAALDTMTE